MEKTAITTTSEQLTPNPNKYRQRILNRNTKVKWYRSMKGELDKMETTISEISKTSISPILKNLGNVSILEINEERIKIDSKKIEAETKLGSLNIDHSKLLETLKSKSITKDPLVYAFLSVHNTVQNNWLKRIFGIEKKFKEVTSKDLKRLLPILNDHYSGKKEEVKKEIELYKTEYRNLGKALEYKNIEKQLNTLKDTIEKDNKEIKFMEKPILKLIENIIDLDIKALKESIKTISISDILFFLKENFKKIVSPKIGENKVILLEQKLTNLGQNLENEKYKNKVLTK